MSNVNSSTEFNLKFTKYLVLKVKNNVAQSNISIYFDQLSVSWKKILKLAALIKGDHNLNEKNEYLIHFFSIES